MCGRYYIEPDGVPESLGEIIAEAKRKAENKGVELKSGEIFPSDVVPVIANGKNQVPSVFPMRWGFPLQGSSGLIINARSETAAARPMFRESARLRRCLIPVTNYYEWARGEGWKVKYAIWPSGSKLFYMGGLYILPPEAPLACVVILTRPVAESIAFIHDRMPVIVPQEKMNDWLSPQIGFDEMIKETVGDMAYKAE